MKKKPILAHSVRVRVTEKEWQAWQQASAEAGFTSVSEWLRYHAKKRIKDLDAAAT